MNISEHEWDQSIPIHIFLTGGQRLKAAYSHGEATRFPISRSGHVFQGRDKAVPVNATDSDPHHFKALADYIHLNPARAGLAGGKRGALLACPWSSLPSHHKGNRPAQGPTRDPAAQPHQRGPCLDRGTACHGPPGVGQQECFRRTHQQRNAQEC